MDEVTALLLLALTIISVYYFRSRSIKFNRITNIPGPTGWPIIGNADFFLGVNSVERALKAFTNMAQANDSPLSRVWLGPKLVILVKSPKYIEALLNHRSAANKEEFFYKAISDVTGNGVFTRNGYGWHQIRKPMTVLVQPKKIRNFQDIICRKVERMCVEIDEKVDRGSFDVSPYIKLCSLEVICEAEFGADDLEFMARTKFHLVHVFEKELEMLFANMWSFTTLLGLKKFDPTPIRQRLGHVALEIMNRRKALLMSLGRNYMIDEPENFADVILRIGAQEEKSDHETSFLGMDFLIAGSDTQSVVTIVLLTLLAMHDDHQNKVYEELTEIFGASDRFPDEDDLKRMVYLEMCIKEALRHCAPPAVARSVEEAILIDGYYIPKGAALLFTLYLTLIDPMYWERPKEFYPEHFTEEASAKRPKGTFLPFVAGPRMCPGQLYSFQVMKTVVSTLIRRYHLTTDLKFDELEYKYLLMREIKSPSITLSKRRPLKCET